jgi:excisionase family DNA binding protein
MKGLTVVRELLTVPEAARALGLSRTTTYRMAREGELPTVAIGARVLIPADLLDQWITDHTRLAIVGDNGIALVGPPLPSASVPSKVSTSRADR